jgi:hypothetical protein
MDDQAGPVKLNVLIVDDNPDDGRRVMREFPVVHAREVVDRRLFV